MTLGNKWFRALVLFDSFLIPVAPDLGKTRVYALEDC
jgi:hypothetical protein